MNRQWYLGLLVLLGLVVLALSISVWLPGTAHLAQAATDWKSKYEKTLPNGKTCPGFNMQPKDKYSFLWCQCTSYVAARLADVGVNPSDFTYNSYVGHGNAENWPKNAGAKNTGKECRRGAVYQDGTHVMWVEECYGNSEVRISEYNWEDKSKGCYKGDYCERTLTSRETSRGTYIYYSNAAPGKPKNLEISDRTKNSAKIRWSSQKGVSYFCVRINDRMTPVDSISPNECTKRVSDGLSYTARNLKANTEYTVVVQACNDNDRCSHGTQERFKTNR